MGVWEFVIIYLGVFMLLQFVVYRYFRQGDDRTPANWASTPNAEQGGINDQGHVEPTSRQPAARSDFRGADNRPPDGPDLADLDAEHVRRCPTCGAGNGPESVYTFCWNCASPLRG